MDLTRYLVDAVVIESRSLRTDLSESDPAFFEGLSVTGNDLQKNLAKIWKRSVALAN
jgi:hypothetical protein